MKSLYERIGGEAAVTAAVELFYEKVLADERIKHFFEGIDMARQSGMQKKLLTFVFGGPNTYDGRSLKDAHAHLLARGLNDSHFDAVAENLQSTLSELKVAKTQIREVMTIVGSVRDDILGRSPDPVPEVQEEKGPAELDEWSTWKKVESCTTCSQYAILADSEGRKRVFFPHSTNCPSSK